MTDPRDVVVALLRATESGDPEEVVRHMADDVVWQNVPLPPARGKATVAKQLRAMHRSSRTSRCGSTTSRPTVTLCSPSGPT
ncbi:nuclear transport factor 2 family protein [Lentzea indica]|uniref:nuclear transport factor 2 family protein n=1 Tax=Lentzea indica TaxID=2604800 RepID=UPI0028ADCA88|nr:nuclear transport factor 2 family protein [Lentzea indica]